jgi:hypothetical protein
MSPAKSAPDETAEESLKRLGGGRWQTRDERFTIEPQSGTWAVVDAEETDDLGLPLVRGPFRSLTDAKAAIAEARSSETPASPLADRLDRRKAEPASKADGATSTPGSKRATSATAPTATAAPEARPRAGVPAKATKKPARATSARAADERPAEPSWFRDLDGAGRGRARRLIATLEDQGVADAESIVRRDLAGGVPALAAQAIAARLADLPDDAPVGTVVQLLTEGRDDALGVRWRIVDGDGRPVLVEPPKRPRRSR